MRLHHWPEFPAHPPGAAPALVLVPTSALRADARRELRSALRKMLSSWTGRPEAALPLIETPRGPAWTGPEPLAISLSYAGSHGLIGVARGARIGVDIAAVGDFPELAAVARDYLGPEAAERISRSADAPRELAAAWAERESRIKCLGSGLAEWTPGSAQAESACRAAPLSVPAGFAACVSTLDA